MPWRRSRLQVFWAIPLEEMRQALAEFQNLHQRSEILTLPGEVTIINDCYNSNPLAMERMLETLADWPGARRRIVVAGEMLELGPTSPRVAPGRGPQVRAQRRGVGDRRPRRRTVFRGRGRRRGDSSVARAIFPRRPIGGRVLPRP